MAWQLALLGAGFGLGIAPTAAAVVDAFRAIDQRTSFYSYFADSILDGVVAKHPVNGHRQAELDLIAFAPASLNVKVAFVDGEIGRFAVYPQGDLASLWA